MASTRGTKKMSPSARRRARKLAVQALYQWQLAGASINDIEKQFREDNDMKSVDVDYFCELLHQVPGQVSRLDEAISPLLDRPLDELSRIELAILRMGAYELLERQDVPFKVVINEGVDLAKTFGATDGHKYVNGILDGLARRVQQDKADKC